MRQLIRWALVRISSVYPFWIHAGCIFYIIISVSLPQYIQHLRCISASNSLYSNSPLLAPNLQEYVLYDILIMSHLFRSPVTQIPILEFCVRYRLPPSTTKHPYTCNSHCKLYPASDESHRYKYSASHDTVLLVGASSTWWLNMRWSISRTFRTFDGIHVAFTSIAPFVAI
jgi:hypothetical protein